MSVFGYGASGGDADPLTEGGEVLLIREYMAGFHDYRLTLPKGSVDPGSLQKRRSGSYEKR